MTSGQHDARQVSTKWRVTAGSAFVAVAITVLALTGCGSADSDAGQTKRRDPAAAAEPHGKLSAAEDRTLQRAFTEFARLEKAGASPTELPRACRSISASSQLLSTVHALCTDQAQFALVFGKLARFDRSKCARAVQAGHVTCFVTEIHDAGQAMSTLASDGDQSAAALRRRGIGGTCALALGLAPELRAALVRASHSASRLARAAKGQSESAALRANRRFRRDLGGVNFGSAAETLRQFGSCPHA